MPETIERDYLAEMRGSKDYKLGYLKGMIRLAIWLLKRGIPDTALGHLERGCKELGVSTDPFDWKAIEEDAVK